MKIYLSKLDLIEQNRCVIGSKKIIKHMETTQAQPKIHLQASMHDEPLDKILLSNEQHAYYRSRLFTPNYAINPLIACAAPLVVLNNKLKLLSNFDNIHLLYQQLEHEINAFVTKAQNRSYPSEAIMLAQYILCIMLDETVLTSTWGMHSGWQTHTLLSIFFKDASHEKFLVFVERILEKPHSHIELLELIYLVLRLGYQGNQINAKISKEKSSDLVDQIYQVIRNLKNEPQLIFHKEENLLPQQSLIKKLLTKKYMLFLAVIFSIFIGLTYLACSFTLAEITKPLRLQLESTNFLKMHDT